ncbi:MAG: hypothetical protein ACW99F_14845, partial [Candidatus Hodarchaeales archaeon]
MELGIILLYIALILGLGAIGFIVIHLITRDEFYLRFSRWSSILSTIFITFTFFLLVYYFFVSNLDIAYVHSYSQTDYTLFYKWGGVLAGADGTLLFWVWLIALSLFIQEIFEYRKEKRHRNKNNDLSFADDKTLFV